MPPEGDDFKPNEPYTHRLRNILEEYPDGSQILREILQNSDDAKSTDQIFILDYNTYQSNSLFNSNFNRFQGPALLAKNNSTFKDRDFTSLLKLADSEKKNQFDKIGVMGVGFNSVYHITDFPSFITEDKYVILDPHEWYYKGGKKFKFVEKNYAHEYPDQFAPYGIPCDKKFDGTIFRYPLRNYTQSDISEKIYTPESILEMFDKFYEKDSIDCLLFLKYIERIHFYVLKKGANKPELLYKIELDNADKVRDRRRLITEKIGPMMDSLKSNKLNGDDQLEATYVASFSRQRKNDPKETSSWLILNYLDSLLKTEAYFQKNYRKGIREHKFIPNVGLAVPLDNLHVADTIGRLFCFLPLPIDMPFLVSVHGYFAVSTNRRTLWSNADNEELASDALARLKVQWNLYLFENVLPKAWIKLLCKVPLEVANISSKVLYKLWPIIFDSEKSSVIGTFCKNLLTNIVEILDINDRVFRGPSSLNAIGKVPNVLANSYNTSSLKESEFHWLSLSNGYLDDDKSFNFEIPKIIGNIGFPITSISPPIVEALKNSKHSLNYLSPAILRPYLKLNRDRWQDKISRKDVLQLFEYILKDSNFDELKDFKMIPLADGKFGTITTSSGSSYVYIDPRGDTTVNNNDECNIFESQLDKFIDKSIDRGLYSILYDKANAGWKLNIKILDETAVCNMIRSSPNYNNNTNSEEIQMPNDHEWIYQLWDNIKYRNWNLAYFEAIHLIPTNNSTLRKLKTPKKVFSRQIRSNNSNNSYFSSQNNTSIDPLVPIFERFGAVFINNKFDNGRISAWEKVTPYIIKPDIIESVLDSFQADISYPNNLNHKLQSREISLLVDHLSSYLRLRQYFLSSSHIEVVKNLPIFTEVDHNTPISLLYENRNWYLLPRDEENSYGKIIYPRSKGGFLNTSSESLCYILEDVIKIPRLTSQDYWRNYVIPFLGSQSFDDMDKIVDKLFDRLPSLINQDESLKDYLGGIKFVPSGTLEMSQKQPMPNNVELVKPTDLFDPEESAITELFFDDEKVFPAGKYGISHYYSSRKFLSVLKQLGIKKTLSPNDIISRIDTILTRKHNDLEKVHNKALKLFKYIDDKWDQIVIGNNGILKAISEKEWIPTVDKSGNKIFSKPRDCYHKKYKNLVCFVSPILDHSVKNNGFLACLNWNYYPNVNVILSQLEFCRDSVNNNEPPSDLKYICVEIYKYMYTALQENNDIFNFIKERLKNKSWILCGNSFRPSDSVVFSLPNKFMGNDSLVVKLPMDYTNRFESLFRAMGVRDEIGVKDLILIVKNFAEKNQGRELTRNEIDNIIIILEHIIRIQKERSDNKKDPENLDGLLIPSTENKLEGLDAIHFDDMEGRLDNETRREYIIAHSIISVNIAKEFKMQTLAGKLFGNIKYIEGFNMELYEQSELLTTRIKNIIKDYPLSQLFKEFLQNADDAGATRFSVFVDQRQKRYNNLKKHLLSDEMDDWQGPAVWIYNDAEFTDDDFLALSKLGVGGKSRDENKDDTRIGRFGIGFNCAFHITDLPSIVSGEYIAFLDPHARFLPTTEYPPKRRKGTLINFLKEDFKNYFPDQCYPYEALFGCDFSKKFKGTLFRLPLRTISLSRQSKISNKVSDISEISKLFDNNKVMSNKEILFLRNIESCDLHHMKDNGSQLIWQVQVKNMSDDYRSIRKNPCDKAQVYRLEIESDLNVDRLQSKKISEIWLLCTGGHERINSDQELGEFAEDNQIKPRGGVASLLALSDNKPLDELKAEPFPNPPELKGEIFSYLSLSVLSNLGVHLNGNFSLSSARNNTLNSEGDFLESDNDNAKWNRYILLEVLPDLHIKLLEEIVKLEKARYEKNPTNFVPHTTGNFWPTNKNLTTDLFKNYGLNVIKKLGLRRKKIFWTEANGGDFVSLSDARIIDEKEASITNILANLRAPIQVVKLNKEKMEELSKIAESKKPPSFHYTPINGKLVCKELQKMRSFRSRNNIIGNNSHNSLFELLTFIIQDESSFENLNKLPLIPLSDGSFGEFGERIYYIGKQKHINLFPSAGPSKFISVELFEYKELLKVFNSKGFSKITNIKKFDASAVLALLEDELPNVSELPWNPNGESVPNSSWLNEIWSILNKEAEKIDFDEISKFPLLPLSRPSDMLVRPNTMYPVLYIPENFLFPLGSALEKLKLNITNMKIPENAHKDLKNCITQCTPFSILNSLEKALLDNIGDTIESDNFYIESMKQLFEDSDLLSSDYEELRKFIKTYFKALISYGRSDEGFMRILRSLPIWQIHLCEDKFINASSGILLPYKLPFFSFNKNKNTNFYKCDSELDFKVLQNLGVTCINELDYVKKHLKSGIIDSTPSLDYIPFLQKVLSLRNHEIENYFKQHELIPNKSLTKFVSANTLYDTNNPLFCSIFGDTDKVLPPQLQNSDPVCLEALGRIGLNRQINCKTYIKCAEEIASQIQQNSFPTNVVKDRARNLVQYLYLYFNTLNFNSAQWNRIKKIKFVPSETDNRNQFYQRQKETTGFETFQNLCYNTYKNICWTQYPLLDENVEPTTSINKRYQGFGFPPPEKIIEHWFAVEKMIKEGLWNRGSNKELKIVLNDIYETMNKTSQVGSYRQMIKLKTKSIRKKIFLNGDDPFDENNWVAGEELVFDLKREKEGMYRVKDCLINYKNLLILAGASTIVEPSLPPQIKVTDQKGRMNLKLLDKLKKQPDKYHDVGFIFNGEGNKKIGASRYVLSAASEYFETMFYGHLMESTEINVPINDIKSNIFWILLLWLYGESFKNAIDDTLRKPSSFTNEEEFKEYYLSSLIDLLKTANFYNAEFKGEVEDLFMDSSYIGVDNVCDILTYSKTYRATRLKSYCKDYIRKNRGIIINQLSENRENEHERSRISQDLDRLLLDDD